MASWKVPLIEIALGLWHKQESFFPGIFSATMDQMMRSGLGMHQRFIQ